jgi:hypothetical protein
MLLLAMTVLARLDAALIGRGGSPTAHARHLAGQIHGLVGVLGAVERHQNRSIIASSLTRDLRNLGGRSWPLVDVDQCGSRDSEERKHQRGGARTVRRGPCSSKG